MSAYYQLLQRSCADNSTVIAHYRPTHHAQGAWNHDEQHMGAASGILAHELEKFMPRSDMRMARISYDIWGKINLCDFSITTQLIRAGKTIELLEAQLQANGRTCIIARAWRMIKSDTSAIKGIEDKPILTPEQCAPWPELKTWPGGFIQSLEGRRDKENRNGKGIIWLTTKLSWLENEPSSDFVHLTGMVDMTNGAVPRQEKPFNFIFPNLDLQLHMYRLPHGRWLGIEALQHYGDDGIGLSSSILHDVSGPYGRCEQITTLRPIQ